MTDKTHPDDVAKRLDLLAREMGYGVTSLTLIGLDPVAGECPEHRYGNYGASIKVAIEHYDREVLPSRVHDIISERRNRG